MTRSRVLVGLAVILVAAAALAPGASAGKPTFEYITIDETFDDESLTEACGVPVVTHAEGSVTLRAFSNGSKGLVQLNTLNISVTATAGDNTYRFRDVGADQLRISPDGTEILIIIGQVPFGFTGVLKINVTTGETILEPHHSLEGRVDDACAALTA